MIPFSLRYDCTEAQDSLIDIFYQCFNSQCALLNQELALAMRMRRKKKRRKSLKFDYCYSEEWNYQIYETAGFSSPLGLEPFEVLDSFEFIIEAEIIDNDPPIYSYQECTSCPSQIKVDISDCDTAWIVSESHQISNEEESIIDHSWHLTDFCDNTVVLIESEHQDADECPLAPERIVSDSCIFISLSSFNANLENETLQSECGNGLESMADIWYKINAENLGSISIKTQKKEASNLQEAVIEVYNDGCESLELIECFDLRQGNLEISTGLMTEELLIRIVTSANLNKQGSFDICFYSTEKTTSTQDLLESMFISIFPNPVSQYLNIRLDESILFDKNMKYSIIDASGRSVDVWERLTNHQKIAVNHLENGVYFLQIVDGDKKGIYQFLKI